jgi:hypothetical protein
MRRSSKKYPKSRRMFLCLHHQHLGEYKYCFRTNGAALALTLAETGSRSPSATGAQPRPSAVATSAVPVCEPGLSPTPTSQEAGCTRCYMLTFSATMYFVRFSLAR